MLSVQSFSKSRPTVISQRRFVSLNDSLDFTTLGSPWQKSREREAFHCAAALHPDRGGETTQY